MKYFFLAFLSIIFFSCTNPLENTYDKISLEKDIIVLKEIVSQDELNELLEYIVLSVSLGVDINGKTYKELFNDIETAKINKKKNENSFSRQNIQELLNQRLENHVCDDFMLEMNKKEIHNHSEKNNKIEWDDDSYFIDY